jgi:hypothetical protein
MPAMQRTGFLGAIGAAIITLLAFTISATAYAEGIAGKGKVTGVTVADGPAFRTGCWVGGKADAQTTSIMGLLDISDSLRVGGGVGCDHVLAGTSFVLGVMADISAPVNTFGTDTGADFDWFVGARLGALLSDRWLAYGLVGGSGKDFDIAGVGSTHLTYGLGTELMLAKNWSTGLEWRRTSVEANPIVINDDTVGAFLRFRF